MVAKSKYGNKKVTVDGVEFDSKLEADYYLHLKQLHKDGVVESFEMQKQYVLLDAYVMNGKKRQPVKFTPDFVVHYADGRIEVVDIKGSKFAVSRDFPLRKKMFEQRYQVPLHVIGYSKIDGGWIDLDDLDKARQSRKKEKERASKD